MASTDTGSYYPDTRTEKEKIIDHHNQLIRMYGFDLAKAYRERDFIKSDYYNKQIAEHKEALKELE